MEPFIWGIIFLILGLVMVIFPGIFVKPFHLKRFFSQSVKDEGKSIIRFLGGAIIAASLVLMYSRFA
jgi:uncharacterized protein YjeT (DUF2065 family)